jgi:uncharacterized Zn finger protein
MSVRDEDRVRGFPAFPPSRGRGRYARTWWGNAWIKAMEDTSLDRERLTRGRRYARAGHVGPITVSPGRIAAPVSGSREVPYRTVVLVQQLTAAEWERFLDQVATVAGHIAALLDRDMPHDLVEAAEDAGVRLLPAVGDLDPDCDCPDWGYPCKHAAALSYQASWLLDEDPFVLLLMRGRGERELLDELQRRNARHAGPRAPQPRSGDTPAGGDPVRGTTGGTPAEQAYARGAPPLPAAPPLPPAPAAAGALASLAPAPGVDPEALALLAADAAVRAHELLAAGDAAEPAPELDEWQDTVRMAATHQDGRLQARLRNASGRPAELARAARAWRYGGQAGLGTLEGSWSPPQADLARARAALAAAWDGEDVPELSVWRNRWTLSGHGVQLRYGRDGRWHPYREEAGRWWPAGPPHRDPAAALTELLGG